MLLLIILTSTMINSSGNQPNESLMFVCVCNKVTDGQIREACENGASSMECLKKQLKVATCCGRCQDCAKRVLRESQAEMYRNPIPLAATA